MAIRAEEHGSDVTIWVEDDGIGISATEKERIFEMFARGQGGADFEGTGIGLSIGRYALEKMGETVGVACALGQGSRF